MKHIFILATILCVSAAAAFSQTNNDSLINYTDITGRRQGYWNKKNAEGITIFEGTFKNDVPIGEFKRYYPTGSLKYIMKYTDNTQGKEVYVQMLTPTEKLMAEGLYINKQKHNTWKYYSAEESIIMEEEYQHGILHGASTIYWQIGNHLPAEIKHWQQGKKHGDWFWFYENGQIRMKAAYNNNKFHGDFIVYFFDGTIHINGHYNLDKRDGVWTYYNEDGSTRYVLDYEMGVLKNQDEFEQQETKRLQEKFSNIPNYDEPDMTDPNTFLDTSNTKKPFDPEDPENFINDPESYIFKSELTDEQLQYIEKTQKKRKKKKK